jgi:uncharacterized membrane protein YjdF
MLLAADVIRASLVLGALWYLVRGEPGAAWGLTVVALTAIAARFTSAPPGIQLAFVAPLAADAWLTTLGAFDHFNHSDHVGHLILAAAVTPVMFHALYRVGLIAKDAERRRMTQAALAVVSGAMTIALGACWELYEWQSDRVLGTHMSLGYSDTLGDLAGDAGGALIGAIGIFAALAWRRAPRRGGRTALGLAGPRVAERRADLG